MYDNTDIVFYMYIFRGWGEIEMSVIKKHRIVNTYSVKEPHKEEIKEYLHCTFFTILAVYLVIKGCVSKIKNIWLCERL